MLRKANVEDERAEHLMSTITRLIAAAGLAVTAIVGTTTAAQAQTIGVQSEGEVACGYDYPACVQKWFEYGESYIVTHIYYRGGGYHFYWWG
jgi:hypothetical protein